MIEMVYCKITGKTRDLPKIHHFIPIEEWAVKKIKGKRKVMPKIIDSSNDGPSTKFQKKEQVILPPKNHPLFTATRRCSIENPQFYR